VNFNYYYLEYFNLLVFVFTSFKLFYLTIQINFENLLAFLFIMKICVCVCVCLLHYSMKIQHNNTIIKKIIKKFRHPHYPIPYFHYLTLNYLLVFTLNCSLNCIFLRFKINKLLIFVVGLAFSFSFF